MNINPTSASPPNIRIVLDDKPEVLRIPVVFPTGTASPVACRMICPFGLMTVPAGIELIAARVNPSFKAAWENAAHAAALF
jgi:hypothetical protein